MIKPSCVLETFQIYILDQRVTHSCVEYNRVIGGVFWRELLAPLQSAQASLS